MDPLSLIPTPDTIPAPSWLFLVLDILTFTLHILVINIVLGGSLITLFSRFKNTKATLQDSLHGGVAAKIPISFALGINLGVAPLLFLQVIYGHLFYASSILLAIYWILIIPLLIIAYYGAYVHIRKYDSGPLLSKLALFITSIILLYIALVFVNNMTLMAQPEKWTSYFKNSGGTILNLGDPTFFPRYLHFIIASVAIAGLFMAVVWSYRQKRNIEGAAEKVRNGLLIFAIATATQIIVGFWFLLSIPSEFIVQFMGQNLFFTIVLFLGILMAIGALISAFLNKLIPTLIHLVVLILSMAINRANLRSLYLQDVFTLDRLELSPQYGVMALFFLVLIVGLIVVGYMLKVAFAPTERRVTS
jgi:hypothetical protein